MSSKIIAFSLDELEDTNVQSFFCSACDNRIFFCSVFFSLRGVKPQTQADITCFNFSSYGWLKTGICHSSDNNLFKSD